MDSNRYINDAVALLKRLIYTPSISRDESAAAELINEELRMNSSFRMDAWSECGKNEEYRDVFAIHRSGNNVWCIPNDYDEDKPTILLNAHIDTVKPVAGWQHDPFVPTLEDEKLYGLGSNDCGGGLVALMQVFIHIVKSNNAMGDSSPFCKYNIIYLASCEEEVSGKNGIESVLPLLPKIDFAIVGEPTGLQPAIAEKGLMVIDATAHGKAGHAARNEGDNAIYHAMEDIKWLSEWVFPLQTELLGPVKNTVTIVNAGTQHNVIPDQCTFTIDVRSNECYTNEEIFNYFQKNLKSELKARSFRLSSSRIEKEHPFVQKCIDRGLVPFGSPTLSDQALMRFPSLKLGPGESSRSHTADEYIKISEIKNAIELYIDLLSNLNIK